MEIRVLDQAGILMPQGTSYGLRFFTASHLKAASLSPIRAEMRILCCVVASRAYSKRVTLP
jgi:hypothetical protein